MGHPGLHALTGVEEIVFRQRQIDGAPSAADLYTAMISSIVARPASPSISTGRFSSIARIRLSARPAWPSYSSGVSTAENQEGQEAEQDSAFPVTRRYKILGKMDGASSVGTEARIGPYKRAMPPNAAYTIGGVVSRKTSRQGRHTVFSTSGSWFSRRIICCAAVRPVSCKLLSMDDSCG